MNDDDDEPDTRAHRLERQRQMLDELSFEDITLTTPTDDIAGDTTIAATLSRMTLDLPEFGCSKSQQFLNDFKPNNGSKRLDYYSSPPSDKRSLYGSLPNETPGVCVDLRCDSVSLPGHQASHELVALSGSCASSRFSIDTPTSWAVMYQQDSISGSSGNKETHALACVSQHQTKQHPEALDVAPSQGRGASCSPHHPVEGEVEASPSDSGVEFSPIRFRRSPTSPISSDPSLSSPPHQQYSLYNEHLIADEQSPPQAFPSTCDLILLPQGDDADELCYQDVSSRSCDKASPPQPLPSTCSVMHWSMEIRQSSVDSEFLGLTAGLRRQGLESSYSPTPHHYSYQLPTSSRCRPRKSKNVSIPSKPHRPLTARVISHQWTFEEKITIALLEARDLQDHIHPHERHHKHIEPHVTRHSRPRAVQLLRQFMGRIWGSAGC
ncbi:hypothetical protein HGRIS_012486 [Hohenbuehelia grisea]|uniref:Uncharacterized protein n=1 Tax=Hohenbuehelia grisea TaxID=104357 RepID=A0ABR3ISH2_9AGAR